MGIIIVIPLFSENFVPFNAAITNYENWYLDQKSRSEFFNDIERIETSLGGIFCGYFNNKVSNIPSLPVDRATKFQYHVKYSANGSSIEFSGTLARDLDHFKFTDELIKWKEDIKPVTIKGINSDMFFAICKLNNQWLAQKRNYPWLSYFCGVLANVGCAGLGGIGSFLCSGVYGAVNTYIQNHS